MDATPSEQDNHLMNRVEEVIMVRPMVENDDDCSTSPSLEANSVGRLSTPAPRKVQEQLRLEDKEQDQEENNKTQDTSLKIVKAAALLARRGELKEVDEEDEGFKTPTGPEYRIPVNLDCPPSPPRKRPRSAVTGRAALPRCRRRLFITMSF